MAEYQLALGQIAGAKPTRVGPATTLTELELPGGKAWRSAGDAKKLASASGLDPDLYACARCVQSEEGSSAAEYLLAVAECVRNEARERGAGPLKLLTSPTDTYRATAGLFGEQHGRWAATSRDPTEKSVAAARAALIGGTRMIGDARKFYSPKVQDTGRQGARALTSDAVGIIERWSADGWEWIGHIPGVDAYRLMLLRFAGRGKAKTREAIAAIEQGRRGGGAFPGADSAVARLGVPAWMMGAILV